MKTKNNTLKSPVIKGIAYAMLTLILQLFTFNSQAQIAVNISGNEPDPSAMLDVSCSVIGPMGPSGSRQGVLIPRISLSSTGDVGGFNTPLAPSLLVYNNGDGGLSPAGFYYWGGSYWIQLGAMGQSGAMGATGSTGVTGATGAQGSANGNGLHFVGESYEGGIIFYVDGTEEHGLIITTTDGTPGGTIWGCKGTNISGTNTTIGTGAANTTLIDNGCSSTTIPAHYCQNLTKTGFSDWYLPSKDELNQVYVNRAAINGLSSFSYWSSSQVDANNAWSQSFPGGTQSSNDKNNNAYTRCIRAF